MVPGVTDVKLTGSDGLNPWARGPNTTGGYQLDGRFLSLQEQALGALLNHAEIQSPPQDRLLDDLSSFQRVLFTNERVRALSEAIDAGQPLPAADPPLNALELQGKAVFTRACAQCHGGPGQSTPQGRVVHFHDISSQCPRPVDTQSPARFNFAPCPTRLARNARTYEFTMPDGTKVRRTSSDPGRALLTGFVGGLPGLDDWNKFDTPGLRGLRHTAPYFHNNSANTLEEVVDHYIEFYKRVQANAQKDQLGNPIPPPIATTDGVNFDRQPKPEERAALLAYLRKL
jgi:cytochrome c peroxidase